MERFAVIKRLPTGSSVWACASDDLTEAKIKMLDLAHKTGHDHFVHDFDLGHVVARCLRNNAEGGSVIQ